MVDVNKPDSYNFYVLVFGCIQQALDIIASCMEYGCIPYIRYPVSFHYITLLMQRMSVAEQIDCVKYFSQIRFPLGSRQLPGQRMRLCIYFQ